MDLRTHHVGITVSDLDRALAFYRDGLGLEVAGTFEVEGEAFATAVGVEAASASFVHLEGDGVLIELVEYEPRGVDRTGGALNDPGTAHVGFRVDDVDAVVTALSADVDRVSEPRTTATGARIVFVRDPDGNLIELLDP